MVCNETVNVNMAPQLPHNLVYRYEISLDVSKLRIRLN